MDQAGEAPRPLYLEDLHVGQRFTSGVYRIDEDRIKAFAAEFDPQPFHLDEAAAQASIFGGLAASGWHTAAITMRLLVTAGLPFAAGVIGLGGDIAWPRPTRAGDVLRVESEIVEILPSRSKPNQGIVKVRSTTLNQDGEPVQVFTGKILAFKRAAELADAGLRIRSRRGDVTLAAPLAVLAENIADPFDLVLLSVKAYDLEDAMASFAPAVGPETAIVPLLNGMRHLEILDERFGRTRVLGGQCTIAATLNDKHEIVHLNKSHTLSFGERDGTMSERVKAIENLMDGSRFDAHASATILLDMWEKWVFLATLAGSTCLMRGAIGDISVALGGADLVLRLLDECRAGAAAEGYPPREAFLDGIRHMLTATGSPLTASMLRDIENGAPIEADHGIDHHWRSPPARTAGPTAGGRSFGSPDCLHSPESV